MINEKHEGYNAGNIGSQLSNVLSQQGSWHGECVQKVQLTGNGWPDPSITH